MDRNGRPEWTGMGGRNQSESVAGMRRNTHKVHDFLRKKKEEGKIREIRTYFNSQGSGMAGFMLVTGGPELLAEGARELENLYMQAAAVVDNLSLQAVSGGTIARIQEHLDRWMDVQKELGFFS